jgi:hypothetical protein
VLTAIVSYQEVNFPPANLAAELPMIFSLFPS